MKKGYTLIEMLVVIAIIGLMLALMIPAAQAVRESSRKTSCAHNLSQIAIAFMNHASAQDRYVDAGVADPAPPAFNVPRFLDPDETQVGWGWAYQLMPYMDRDAMVAREQDRIWTPQEKLAHDARVAAMIVPSYFCPSRRRPGARPGTGCGIDPGADLGIRGGIDYAANGGTGDFMGIDPRDGVIVRRGRPHVGPGDVAAGASHTLLVGERGYAHAVLDEDNGYVAGYTWDTVRWGAEPPMQDTTSGVASRRFGSAHGLGGQFAFVDASVKTLTYDIDPAAFRVMCTR